jgi:hypothetical protein
MTLLGIRLIRNVVARKASSQYFEAYAHDLRGTNRLPQCAYVFFPRSRFVDEHEGMKLDEISLFL